jgi:hypothetical protein
MYNTNITFCTYIPYRPFGGLCHLDGATAIYSYTVALILVAIISTIENLVVIIVIFRYKVLRTPSLICLGPLAVIDLITGSIVTPINIGIILKVDLNTYQSLHAIMLIFLAVVMLSFSTVMLITFNRLEQIYYLEKYKMTKKKMMFILLLYWISPIIVILSLERFGECWFAFLYLLTGSISMIIVYVIMILALKRHMSNSNDGIRQTCIEIQRQAMKTTLIIIVTCIAMHFPQIFAIALGHMGIGYKVLCAIALFALLANSAVNPLIYYLCIPVMKKHILMFLRIETFTKNTDEGEDELSTVVAETNI